MTNPQHLFSGYLNTPPLWHGSLESLAQFELPEIPTPKFTASLPPSLRLGHLAERFTFALWNKHTDLELLAHNLQISGEEQTLGEIDAILRYRAQLFHVEIAYKIYLYDPAHGKRAVEHWIGPNRKDSLIEKIQRLRDHQLPLVLTPEAQTAIDAIIPNYELMESRVWVKGQLFLPHGVTVDCRPLNAKCVAGTYISVNDLHLFRDASFFLPTKQEWLCTTHAQVPWKNMEGISEQIAPLLEKQYSPMLWLKKSNGELSKLFVVWW